LTGPTATNHCVYTITNSATGSTLVYEDGRLRKIIDHNTGGLTITVY
jgi:hypothetical protein